MVTGYALIRLVAIPISGRLTHITRQPPDYYRKSANDQISVTMSRGLWSAAACRRLE